MREANARLIAAAPALAEALELILDAIAAPSDDFTQAQIEAMGTARAVLYAAKGESE